MADAMVAPSGAPANRPGAPVPPGTGYSPNPTMPQYQGQPQSQPSASTSAPAGAAPPVTADPRDAAYYDQLARLTYAYNNALSGYNQNVGDDAAAYNYTAGQLAQQEPLTLAGARNRANSQGLLESGALAQTVGSDEANYAAKRYAASTKLTAGNQTAADRLAAALNSYNTGAADQYTAAEGRAVRSDLATQPTTPVTGVKPPSARRMAKGGATTAGNLVGQGVASALRRTAARQVTKKNG